MKTTDKKTDAIVGVYNTHHDLVEALKILRNEHFPMGHVGVVGKGEALEDIDNAHTWEETVEKGAFIGSTIGLLTGLTMVLVPEIGLIYLGGTFLGPLIGGISGANLGALGGTLLGTLIGARHGLEGSIEGHKDHYGDAATYKEYVEKGKFLLLVHGPKDEVTLAHKILSEHSEVVLHNHIAIS